MNEYLPRLEREIRNQAATVANGVVMRREHPTYGYTKASLRRDLHRLEGMLSAWLLITGRWDAPGTITPALRAASLRELDIDLETLTDYVEES